MTSKQLARQVIDSLPDEASLDDIIHALYLKAKFDHGLDEVREGGGIPHEDATERLRKWAG